jgi:hypothetical protein
MFEATLVMDFGGVHTLTVSLYGFWDGRLGEFGGYEGTYTVVSGTGHFRGAGGSGTLTGVYLNATYANALVVLEGEIVLP